MNMLQKTIVRIIDNLLSHNLLDMGFKKIYEREIFDFLEEKGGVDSAILADINLVGCDCKKDGIDALFSRIDVAINNANEVKQLQSDAKEDWLNMDFEERHRIGNQHFERWMGCNTPKEKADYIRHNGSRYLHQMKPVQKHEMSKFISALDAYKKKWNIPEGDHMKAGVDPSKLTKPFDGEVEAPKFDKPPVKDEICKLTGESPF